MNLSPAALDKTFSALADPTRRAILSRLARGESSAGELAAPFEISWPAISKHLRVLEDAGLMKRERDGRVHRCRLEPGPMKDAAEWISFYRRFWEGQLDALANFLDSTSDKEEQEWPERKAGGETTLRITRTFNAPREKVFQAWTTPEELKKWFGPEGVACPEAEVDLRPGGRYRIAFLEPEGDTVHVGGVFKEVRPPGKLVYTWEWESGDSAGMGETLVTVEFLDRKGSTELTLTHERFPNEDRRDHHGMGWNGCLDSLVKFLA